MRYLPPPIYLLFTPFHLTIALEHPVSCWQFFSIAIIGDCLLNIITATQLTCSLNCADSIPLCTLACCHHSGANITQPLCGHYYWAGCATNACHPDAMTTNTNNGDIAYASNTPPDADCVVFFCILTQMVYDAIAMYYLSATSRLIIDVPFVPSLLCSGRHGEACAHRALCPMYYRPDIY